METIKAHRLVFTAGSSDKEYRLQLEKDKDLYLVNFQYGRRNGTLNPGTKTKEPVTLAEAEKIFAKLLKEEIGGGYVPDDASQTSSFIPVAKEDTGTIPQLLNEMTEQDLVLVTNDKNFVIQPKHDGERRMIFKTESDCFGGNKKGQKVSLPQAVIKSLKKINLEADGEIIGETLFLFDLLSLEGVDYRKQDYVTRLTHLLKLKFGPNVQVVESAMSTEEKKALIDRLKDEGAEGVVSKDLREVYTSSRPHSGGPALKYKFYSTATVKISSLTKGKRSVQMALQSKGLFEDVGAVTIPANKEIPSVGDLAEVRYLYAYKGGSIYQPTYLGKRTDVDDSDADIKQLKYKQD